MRGRIDESHRAFFNSLNFAAVTVILVFTQTHVFRDVCHGSAFREYQKTHPHIHDFHAIPESDRATWRALVSSTYEFEKRQRLSDWRDVIGTDIPAFFVSDQPQGKRQIALEIPSGH